MRDRIFVGLSALTLCAAVAQSPANGQDRMRASVANGPGSAGFASPRFAGQSSCGPGHSWRRGWGGGGSFGYSTFGYGLGYSVPTWGLYYSAAPPVYSYYSFGYPFSYGLPYGPYGTAYPTYSFGYPFGYSPYAGPAAQGAGFFPGTVVPDNAAMQDALLENELRWNRPLDATRELKPKRIPIPSTAEARVKSLRFQALGDGWMQKQDYGQAYQRYKQAVDAADDRGEAHFRVGFALVAMGRYTLAVQSFQRGIEIDPSLAATGQRLDEIYGEDNELAKTSFIHKVAGWVRDDIRDPERLFLLGVLMHYNNDAERADEVFEAAYRLAGRGNHLLAFLNPVREAGAEVKGAAAPAVVPAAGTGKAPTPLATPPTFRPVPPPVPRAAPAGPIGGNGAGVESGVEQDGPQLPPLPAP